MPKTLKKAPKATKKTSAKDEAINSNLRIIGAVMSLASILMSLLPLMYSGVYEYISQRTYSYISHGVMTSIIMSGFVVALLYFLLAIHIVKAGENNTRLIRGVYALNLVLFILSIVAGVLLFLPWPAPTFSLVMRYFAGAEYIQPGIVPMFIMIFVDMALIIGLLAASSAVTYACTIRKKS